MIRRLRHGRTAIAVRDEFGNAQPRLTFALAVCRLLPLDSFVRVRAAALRMSGIRVGVRTVFAGRLHVGGGTSPATNLRFGDDCFVNDGCRFDTTAAIEVGDNVYFGQDVAVITSTHEIGSAHRRAHTLKSEQISIGDGSWVGTRAVILPGASIGPGSVVAAGAVVTRAVAPGSLVAGVPARLLRQLD